MKISNQYKALAENIPDSIARWDLEGRYLYINPILEKTLGIKASEIRGKKIDHLFPHLKEIIKGIEKVTKGEEDSVVVLQTLFIGNEKRVHEVSIVAEKDHQEKTLNILGIGRDITKLYNIQEELKRSLDFSQEIINSIPDLLFEIDEKGNYLNFWHHDRKFADSYKEILIGKNIKDILPKESALTAFEAIDEASKKKIAPIKRYFIDTPEGKRWYEGSLVKKRDGNLLGHLRDITEHLEIENRIRFLAEHDPLTQLLNLKKVASLAQKAFHHAQANNHKVGIFFLDLDNFKKINDTQGHSIGDEILKMVAQRLKNSLQDSYTLGRIGGDEFVLIVPKINNTKEIRAISKTILQQFEKPFFLNRFIEITLSIGIAVYPQHGTTYEHLLHKADKAMYQVKQKGKNGYFISQGIQRNNYADHLNDYFKIDKRL